MINLQNQSNRPFIYCSEPKTIPNQELSIDEQKQFITKRRQEMGIQMETETVKKPAWSILRRSTRMQDLSIEQQREYVRKKASEMGYYIEKEYILNGISGKWLGHNPIFQQMIADSKSGLNRGKPIFAYDVSRAGRMRSKEKMHFEYEVEQNDQRFIYLAEAFRYDGSTGDNFHQFISHEKAHEDSIKTSRDTFRGQKTWASLGIWVGGTPPYGTERMLIDHSGTPIRILLKGEKKAIKTEHVKLVKSNNKERIDTLNWILKQYGMHQRSIISIADDLNNKGIKAPYGGSWTVRTISEIIRRIDFYSSGTMVWNKRARKEYGKVAYNQPSEYVVKEGALEPIIDKTTADFVIERLNRQSQHKVGPSKGMRKISIYSLSGLLTCSHCDGPINAYSSIRKKILKTGELRVYHMRYYGCTRYQRMGKSVCPKWLLIPKLTLESKVINKISEMLPMYEKTITNLVNHYLVDSNRVDEVATLESEVSRLKKSIDQVLDAIANGLSHTIANPKINELNGRIKYCKVKLNELKKQNIHEAITANLADIRHWLNNLPTLMENGSPEEKRNLMRIFVEGGTADPNTRTVRIKVRKMPTLESLNNLVSNVGTQSMSGNGCGGWI